MNETIQVLKERVNLNVKFEDKDVAKENGAKWDDLTKQWYAPRGTNVEGIRQWTDPREFLNIELSSPNMERIDRDTLLVVSPEERKDAEIYGFKVWKKHDFYAEALADGEGDIFKREKLFRVYYAEEGTPVSEVSPFLPTTKSFLVNKYISDEQAKQEVDSGGDYVPYGMTFDEAISSIDGNPHDVQEKRGGKLRIGATGKGKNNGALLAQYSENKYNTRYLNVYHFHTRENHKFIESSHDTWHKLTGDWEHDKMIINPLRGGDFKYVKLPTELFKTKKMIAQVNDMENAIDLYEIELRTAFVSRSRWDKCTPASPDNPYLVAKGIPPHLTRENWRKSLMIDFRDKNGFLWSTQEISKKEDGGFFKMNGISPSKKEAERGIEYKARKKECFHVIGGTPSGIKDMDALVLVEGYSTGASLHEAIKRPVIVTVDAGNLELVARVMRKEHPHKIMIIAGDNDAKNLLKPNGINVGVEVAEKIRNEHSRVFLAIPDFTEKEIADKNSDWNDLYSLHGEEVVVEQFQKKVSESKQYLIEKAKEKAKERYVLTESFIYSQEDASGKEEKLFQVEAGIDFTLANGVKVSKGEKGAWVENIETLSNSSSWGTENIKILGGVKLPQNSYFDANIEIRGNEDIEVAEKLTVSKIKKQEGGNSSSKKPKSGTVPK